MVKEMRQIASWGGLSVKNPRLLAPDRYLTSEIRSEGALPFGNGRSYGDSCLNAAGSAITSQSANRILSFDKSSGLLEAEAGILLSDIIAAVAPHGWFPVVVPGTQFVTLGGAIANDIHGKNHHRRGTFGCHVVDLLLERSDQGPVLLNPTEESGLFDATIGGMGLTGLIRKATIQLMKVGSSSINQVTTRFESLEAYFELVDDADAQHEYAVAWIDSLVKGRHFGRGHLIAGDHAAEGEHPQRKPAPRLSIPLTPPISPLQGPFLKLFNESYFRSAPVGRSEQLVAFDKFFFPLDRVGRWNRLYGPRGLHQHQSAIPPDNAFEVIKSLLECTQRNHHGSFLTVLKRFGSLPSPGILSFPRPGFTLTLDFPDKGSVTHRLLEQLDAITIQSGGAVNPYKDRRMSSVTFRASFPSWQEIEKLRDPALMSDFWRRTVLDGS